MMLRLAAAAPAMTAGALVLAVLLSPGCSRTPTRDGVASTTRDVPSATPVLDDFGFPLGFSVTKMDRSADPRAAFLRFAAGRWIAAARIPAETVRISSLELVSVRVQAQLEALTADAARTSATAAKGDALQQVGDLYAAGMDVARLDALGPAPLAPLFARIDAVDGPRALAELLAYLSLVIGEPVIGAPLVGSDTQDRSRYAIYTADGTLPMSTDNYLVAGAAPIRDAYVEMVRAKLVLAGLAPDEARAVAGRVLELETRVARRKLTPVDARDPNKRFVKMPVGQLRAILSNVDLDTLFAALHLPVPDQVIVVEGEALRERNALLAEWPMADIKRYLRWEVVRHLSPYLSTAYLAPSMAFSRAMYGKMDAPARERLVTQVVTRHLAHPVSQLYVERHFPPATRSAATTLVNGIRDEFRSRLEANTWLSADTRTRALEKLATLTIAVGYPDAWVDLRAVEIRRDDYLGNILRLNEFESRRDLARYGGPVKEHDFSVPGATTPVDINAAYQAARNRIEIAAAILQPPFFDPKADVAVNACTMGAVIGHEITHGFDAQGRLSDAAGNVRNWWTDADSRHFLAENAKLVAQAEAFEVLPGLPLNGALSAGENLADTGGLSLGHAVLMKYLATHPDANVTVDGLTPSQRCFVAWGQLWADKATEGFLRQVVPNDGHPPGVYRAVAPAQHEPAFFEAFGIRAGDALWLDEARRVRIW